MARGVIVALSAGRNVAKINNTRFALGLFVIFCINSVEKKHLSANLLLYVFLFNELKDVLLPLLNYFSFVSLSETRISYSVLCSEGQPSLFNLIFQF